MLSFSLKYMIINIRLRQRNWYVSQREKHCSRLKREPYLCKGYSPCCCRGTTQRTRRIAKWKELQLKRLLNDQQLCAAATAGVRRKQGKMLATNKQETSCWYVHVHTLFRCVVWSMSIASFISDSSLPKRKHRGSGEQKVQQAQAKPTSKVYAGWSFSCRVSL